MGNEMETAFTSEIRVGWYVGTHSIGIGLWGHILFGWYKDDKRTVLVIIQASRLY